MPRFTVLRITQGRHQSAKNNITRSLVAAAILLCLPSLAWATCPAGVIQETGQTDAAIDLRDVATYDAAGQLFEFDSNVTQYPIDIRADSWCWQGGAVHRTNPEDETWSSAKHPNNTGIFAVGTAVIEGVRFHNTHDAIRPARDPSKYWTVQGVWVSYNRDDCIENDWFASGLVNDSMFDGCYTFLSSRDTTTDHAPATVTIQNSLIRLEDMPGPYGHDDPTVMGHGALFKYESDSPHLILKNNIFLMEEYVTTKNSVHNKSASYELLGLQPGKLDKCSGNVIVWTGPGDFPGNIPHDSSCVTVTTDRKVWENARAQWIANHPLVERIDGVDDPISDSAPAPDTSADTTTTGTTTTDTGSTGTTTTDTTTTDTTTTDTATTDTGTTTTDIGSTGTTTTDTTTTDTTTTDTGTTTTDTGTTGTTTTDTTTTDTTVTDTTTTGTTTTDTQPPSVNILNPAQGSQILPATVFSVDVTVSDNIAVARLEVSVDNSSPRIFEGDGTHSFSWTVDTSRKLHVIRARAYDASGNKAADRSWFYTLR